MNFQFKDSKYDFDQVLKDAGYKAKIYEEATTFIKELDIKNEFSDKFTPIKPFTVVVTRPNVLEEGAKYENGSPYIFSFLFCVSPMHAIRRVQWDTFPGDEAMILDTMIKIVESEAESCCTSFMHTGDVLIKSIKKDGES
jgi:hypothetical protein